MCTLRNLKALIKQNYTTFYIDSNQWFLFWKYIFLYNIIILFYWFTHVCLYMLLLMFYSFYELSGKVVVILPDWIIFFSADLTSRPYFLFPGSMFIQTRHSQVINSWNRQSPLRSSNSPTTCSIKIVRYSTFHEFFVCLFVNFVCVFLISAIFFWGGVA